MEREFVPYKLAVKLKELGFDEKCLSYSISNTDASGRTWTSVLVAPLFQQVFRWFRDTHNIRHNITDFIDDEEDIEWDYEIAIIGTDVDEKGNYKPLVNYSTDDENRKFKSYEEAELSCLNNLIEIVESKLKSNDN